MAKEHPNYLEHITTDPMVCHGEPCIRGTRIPVSVVLDNLAVGMTPQEITQSYPSLTPQDIQASVAYAADLARERIVLLAAPGQ
ncbi:MAG: DUF433 domain-containing protein [Dehalococcoidia bacterium]|nr:DUF433 domain-containing protein [Dehalococcoidia bacterium]